MDGNLEKGVSKISRLLVREEKKATCGSNLLCFFVFSLRVEADVTVLHFCTMSTWAAAEMSFLILSDPWQTNIN